jgi:hypothetical protein
MAHKNWREATADLVMKIPRVWFTDAGIRLALTILVLPIISYLVYPTMVAALHQMLGAMH